MVRLHGNQILILLLQVCILILGANFEVLFWVCLSVPSKRLFAEHGVSSVFATRTDSFVGYLHLLILLIWLRIRGFSISSSTGGCWVVQLWCCWCFCCWGNWSSLPKSVEHASQVIKKAAWVRWLRKRTLLARFVLFLIILFCFFCSAQIYFVIINLLCFNEDLPGCNISLYFSDSLVFVILHTPAGTCRPNMRLISGSIESSTCPRCLSLILGLDGFLRSKAITRVKRLSLVSLS